MFYDTAAKLKIDEIIAKYGNVQWVPLENIYFISIDDLDFWVQCENQNSIGFANLLDKAILDESKPETAKFSFNQYIFQECPDVKVPEHLYSHYEKLIEKFKDLLKQSE